MTLADLLAAACRGDGPLPLDSAARLYGAVTADLDAGNFGGSGSDIGRFPVAVTGGDDTAIVDVNGLRYLVELEIGGSETVSALCLVPGCSETALTRTTLARVCREHLSHLDELAMFVLNMPLAGDDRGENWEEEARREIRVRRLEAWQEELDARERELELAWGLLASVRS